ncbi:MAG: rod shape-determining protein RodA [Bacteroidetes bacterium]|nr:rod shape-determining protein RodA [Bacteroidota bacterium]
MRFFSRQIKLKSENKVVTPISDKLDLTLLIAAFGLILIGILSIYSATINVHIDQLNYEKQLIWAIVSVFVFVTVYFIPLKYFNLLAFPSYVLSIIFLVAVLIIGKKISGSQSWISFGLFDFQPSELAKIAVVLALSDFISRKNVNINSPKHFIIAVLMVLLPFALILKQPDLGTALVFVSIIFAGLFWQGLSAFAMFVIISPIIVGISSIISIIPALTLLLLVIAALYFFKRDFFISTGVFILNLSAIFFVDYALRILSPHQIKRIQTFLDPVSDPLGSGYNAIQAKVAVGSGGLFGKGFLEGSQTQLKFIPEQWTDFIFCVIGEEFGFIGSIFTLSLFLILIFRMIRIAKLSKSDFRSNVIMMIVAIFMTHIFINVGMSIGLVPVIGIPLPLVSYGGSALLTNVLMIAIVMNFYKNRTSYS